MSDDLREALAKIKPGDEVTVALDWVSNYLVRYFAPLTIRSRGGAA